jgi:hypothetical protein
MTSGEVPGEAALVLSLQRDFDDAELRADTEALQRLLADDFLSIGEQGHVLDKAQWIARHADFRFRSLRTTEVSVRRYDRTAILRGVQSVEAVWQDQPLTLNVRLSQVWVDQDGGWRLAAVQFSSLPRND